MEPLLPEHKNTHRFGGGRPRVPDRQCADAIFFVLRTGCQWNALSATGICPSSTAHDRFQAWVEDGFFVRFWQAGLAEYDAFNGIDWSWLSMDGAMTKAPLAGEKNRPRAPWTAPRAAPNARCWSLASGVPVGLSVAGANKNDFKLFVETLLSSPVERPTPSAAQPQHLCLDKGYDFEEVRGLAAAFGFVAHIRSRGEDAPATEVKPGQKARRSRRRAHARLDEPLPQPADPLGQKSRELPGAAPLRLRLDCLPGRRVIRIGP
jgi:transposase